MTKTWLGVAEKGSLFGIRFFFVACTVFGRGVARFCLKPVVLYYVLFHGKTRRASCDYLRRVTGKATFWMAFRHMLTFAEISIDRVFFLQGRFSQMRVASNGFEQMRKLQVEKRGAILLGAHLGSFEAMRALASSNSVPLNIVGYFKNARLINGVLQRLNPTMNARLISVEPGVDFVLKLKERIEAGELVAVLGDRVGLGDRVVEVDLLGGKARLPAGPYWLAATLRCPVFLTFGLFHEPGRYDLYCEPFAELIDLPRGHREAGAQAYAQRFADRLEHYCRLAPDNWFNFYDFWRSPA